MPGKDRILQHIPANQTAAIGYKSLRPKGHITSKIYRTLWRISQIPQGIYIAANKKLPSEEGSFIVSN